MELKLYNRVKRELLGELVGSAENNDTAYQKLVEDFASASTTGIKKVYARRIQDWLRQYNSLLSRPFKLRYYQILALYFTEYVLSEKRAGKGFSEQKALAYWMATGSGKTLLMHLNLLQYIDHIGGGSAFDELHIILTTPGVNLIEQHQRELSETVRHLNRFYSNRIKLTCETTAALLNKEAGFFNLPDNKRLFRLVLVDEGHIGLAGGGREVGAFKALRSQLLAPENSFLFEYSATYHGIADKYVQEYQEQIVYDYNYYRFFKDGYGKDYAFQSLNDDRFADTGQTEAGFFDATLSCLQDKLATYEQLTVNHARHSGELPFSGRFPHKPLLAYMGNTVEDPKNEGKGRDEVSDIRKFVVWLAHLSTADKQRYAEAFNGQYLGQLTLTRSPGIADEIWLSFGDGDYWGLINVGNGDKFFNDCAEHPQLQDEHGQLHITLRKAAIVGSRYGFAGIDDLASPINVLVGSRKFSAGWNCYRVSLIGLINLGAAKGNMIIQIFGRGVRLQGLKEDGKRRNSEHCLDYQGLLAAPDSADKQLRRLETLNVFSLNRSWLETFLQALNQDIPAISGPYCVEVQPAVVRLGKKRLAKTFADYQDKLLAFKVGLSEFDAPLQAVLNPASHEWQWRYRDANGDIDGVLQPFAISLDYRSNPASAGVNVVHDLSHALAHYGGFMTPGHLQRQLAVWSVQQRVQFYVGQANDLQPLTLAVLLPLLAEVRYDRELDSRSLDVIERIAEEVQRDLLDKVFHKIRYVIDKRAYRYEAVKQAVGDEPGDFIERYTLTYEFANQQDKQHFEAKAGTRADIEQALQENRGAYHIYEPLLGEADADLLKPHKLQRIGISPDKLNGGEKKFLRDILAYIDLNFAHDQREFYLMRNVESLRSIGLYLEGETRVFYPDFVLWIVNDKKNETTIVLFDPKGQTGIIDEAELGISGKAALNEKVTVATGRHLAELARELTAKTGRKVMIHSFILLRDSSKLGRPKGSSLTDKELALAEEMIRQHILRLDWHEKRENGSRGFRLDNGETCLSRLFAQIAGQESGS
ncbi:DEAD/DEAH box helicase family protein [Methylomonas rhizoryzae]|uniref:DEAD/DEAH box helicase family protein n=1 Tax=Methylomonas rhizoryzae TaxID=2608981 RepID=UPI0012328FDA|nr:DEAD/DEAH box helicase family protein [Methylomonas rhizoryzae]